MNENYLTRVAEAVRDACAETCNEQHTIAERRPIPATICAMHIGHIDLPAVIASVPRPESVAAQATVPDGWKLAPVEPSIAACIIGSNAAGGAIDGRQCAVVYRAMLAAAPEAPQVAVPDRRVSACLTAMNHISTETLESFNRVGIKFYATRGYAEELEAEITTLREQNAALVAALGAIDDLTARAGFEFGGPLAVSINKGLGDRGEFFELACIANGYFEAISKHTENALASVKGDK